jgi:hypothetical protein
MSTKHGELTALAALTPSVKSKLTPLFVVHPIAWDYDTEAPSKSVSDHVAGLGKKLASQWGTNRAFLDPVFLIVDPLQRGNAEHPLHTVVGEAADHGLPLVPVISPGQHPSDTAAAKAVHAETGVGACVRLLPRHWPTSPARARELDELTAALGLGPADADLVFDLGIEVHNELATELARAALQALPHADSWRSLTLAGGAFPRDLSGIPKNRISRLPRLDWEVFSEVSAEAADGSFRRPDFGDYAVAHPDPTMVVDPRVMSISANLRYTTDEEWLVAKGELAVPLATMIANADEFCQADFSAGDQWIDEVARFRANGGSPAWWRWAGTNHHLVFITESLSTPRAPSCLGNARIRLFGGLA